MSTKRKHAARPDPRLEFATEPRLPFAELETVMRYCARCHHSTAHYLSEFNTHITLRCSACGDEYSKEKTAL